LSASAATQDLWTKAKSHWRKAPVGLLVWLTYEALMYAGDYPARQFNAGLHAYQAHDYAQALVHFQKSADTGDGDALNYLGILYEEGLGTAKDPVKAVSFYKKAAAKESNAADVNLGYAYHNGIGVGRDETQAVTWYREAAARGNANGEYWLAMHYESGEGVARNDAEAARLLTSAAARV